MDLYEELKDGRKGRIGDSGMFHNPVQRGVLYVISRYSYNDFIMQRHADDNSYGFQPKSSEHLLWYIEELLDFLEFHNFQIEESIKNRFTAISTHAETLFDNYFDSIEYEYEYYEYLDYKNRELKRILDSIKDRNNSNLEKISEHYIIAVAGRIFHDRELCAWISNLIIEIGFPGEFEQWVERVSKWPTWVKHELMTREGGRCAIHVQKMFFHVLCRWG